MPIILGLLIFVLLHVFRRLSRVEYTPSYFAIFPLSMLDHQLSLYFGEFYGGEYLSMEKGRKPNSRLFLKSLVSFFLTFFLVPAIVGLVIAFFVLPNELRVFLLLLLVWQAINCTKAVFEFSSYRWQPVTNVWIFFGSFYAFYLAALFFVIRMTYRFAQPFASEGNFVGLFASLEQMIVPFVISIIVVGVLGGLFTEWLMNKDALKPPSHDEDKSQ
jgi:hypothetical protein